MNQEQHHTPTPMELELAALRAENLRLKQKGSRIKVSEKGAVSVYGLGRFPVTLYAAQWEKLNALMPEIGKFIADNAASISRKEA